MLAAFRACIELGLDATIVPERVLLPLVHVPNGQRTQPYICGCNFVLLRLDGMSTSSEGGSAVVLKPH